MEHKAIALFRILAIAIIRLGLLAIPVMMDMT